MSSAPTTSTRQPATSSSSPTTYKRVGWARDGRRERRRVARHRGEEGGQGRSGRPEEHGGSDPPDLLALRRWQEGVLRARGGGGVLLPGRRAQGGMLHTGSEELEWGLSEPGRQA